MTTFHEGINMLFCMEPLKKPPKDYICLSRAHKILTCAIKDQLLVNHYFMSNS